MLDQPRSLAYRFKRTFALGTPCCSADVPRSVEDSLEALHGLVEQGDVAFRPWEGQKHMTTSDYFDPRDSLGLIRW
jgi:hypothetical protein